MKFRVPIGWRVVSAIALLTLTHACAQAPATLPVAAPSVAGAPYITSAAFDWAKLLPPPPAPGSIAAQADLETVLHVQDSRTAEQIAWAREVAGDDVFKNARVLGPWFTPRNLPYTAAFFRQVDADSAEAAHGLKKLYPRLRPPWADSRVHPCIEVAHTGSYPSGHSSRAWMWAELLAQIFPEQRVELYARARAVMWGRVIGGAHFPSDTVAGERTGRALAAELLKNPAVRAALEKCRAEAAPFLLKKAA